MIDQEQSLYYVAYFLLCVSLGLCYIKVKSTEGITITTKEFKLFQSSFLNAYSLLILCELLTSASFFHVFTFRSLSLEQITKLYIVTVVSTTLCGVLAEIVDIGSKKDKCVFSAVLYAISMVTILSGDHYEMLLIGRLFYGAGAALQQTSFESYAVFEHTNRGFPDDWLTQTFTHLSHAMSLVAVLAGVVGQTSTSTAGPLGIVGLALFLFLCAAAYIAFLWTKDASVPKFNLSGYLGNVSQAVGAARANKSLATFLVISTLCESSIIIFTFYWAPWITTLTIEEASVVPFEIVFSCYVIASMLGNYLYQLFGAQLSADQSFQLVLLVSSMSFFLGSVFQTSSMAFFMSLLVQLGIGGYWPCVGALRARVVMPEMRSAIMTLTRVGTAAISVAVLTNIHHSPLMMLGSCALFNGTAAYLQHANQGELSKTAGVDDDDDDFDDDIEE